MFNIDEIRSAASSGTIEVEFYKADNSVRKMVCTTKDVPVNPKSEGYKPSDTIVTVWDIEADGWRSFKIDKVIKWGRMY